MSEALEVVTGSLPPTLIVSPAPLLAQVKGLHVQAVSLVITDAETAAQAAQVLREVEKTRKAIDDARLNCKRPFMDLIAKIDTAAGEPLGQLKSASDEIRKSLGRWDTICQERARAAEAARLAEEKRLRDLEAQAQRDREAAARAAAQARQQAEATEFDGLDEVAADMAVAKVQQARTSFAAMTSPAPVARPAGISYRETLTYSVVDLDLVPDAYVKTVLNERAVELNFLAGWKSGLPVPSCPGLSFVVDRKPVLSSRR